MAEQEPQRQRIEVAPGIFYRETHVGGSLGLIPSDDHSPFGLDILHGYDLWISMADKTKGIVIPMNGIRFRTYSGGGTFPFIYNEFTVVKKAFLDNNGQIPDGYNGQLKQIEKEFKEFEVEDDFKRVHRDPFPAHARVKVETYGDKSKPKIKVLDIPCDDDGKESQLDIEIAQNGDVTIRMRATNRISFHQTEEPTDEDYQKGQMVFKTAENGGKYPIMAFIFTKIAERMLKAYQNSRI